MKKIVLVITIALLAATARAQCTSKIQIESILVDACNAQAFEPNNEMVRFKNGPNPLNISSISISGAGASGVFSANKWPNTGLTWNGLVQSATTASVTAALQASVVSSCGKLIEPPGGIIPANADVLMIGSDDPSITDNSFANLIDTLYIVYHNATYSVTTGHFANYGTPSSTRSLIIFDNAHGCSDTVSYDISLLVSHGNGDAVAYNNAGNATYYNDGCQAAFVPIGVTTSAPASACSNANVNLSGVISGPAASYTWTTSGTGIISPSTGTLVVSTTTTVTPTYTPGVGESGTVTFTLTAQGKCLAALATSTVSIFINPAPTPSITSSNGTTICNGNNTLLTASSTGTLSTTWSWNPGSASTSTLTVSPPTGTQVYTITATNACGSTNASFTVTTNPLPTITVINDSICANTSNGTLNASGASTYTWSNGVQTASLSATAGTYSVTGTDANGCKNTVSASIVSISLPTITTNLNAICIGVTNTLTASGGAANSYTWSPGGPSGNDTYVVTPASNTSIVVTGANSQGCLNTHTVTINASPTLTVNNPTTCSGQAVTLQANPTTLTTYSWTGVSSSSSTASVAPNSTASYTVSGTDANGCVSNDAVSTVSVTASSQISVTLSSNLPCVGSTYTLTANGASTYTWVPSSGSFTSLDANNTQISAVQGASATSFTVVGLGSCPATPTVVTINPAPVSTLTITAQPNNATVCNGNTVTLTAIGANSYTWTPLVTNGVAFTPTVSAIYSVSATDANGCATANSTFSVTVNNLPTFTVNSPPICAGQTATLTASQATYTYTWQGSASTSPSITVTPVTTPQTYTVSAIDANGCLSSVVTATINTNATPTISIVVNPNNATICAGGTVTLNASGASTYTWTGGVINNIPFIPATSPLTQTYSVMGTDGNGCVSLSPQTATININPTTTLSIMSSPVCAGDSSNFIAMGASTYTWSTSAITSSITVLASNNQTYTVVGTDVNNCFTQPFVATAIVNPLPNITITPSANSVCAGSTVTLTANGAGSGGSYTWDDGTTNTTLIDNPVTQTSYSVIGVDANNCSSTNVVTITVNPLPTAQTITGNTFVCIGTMNAPTVLSAPNAGTWTGPAPLTTTVSANSTSVTITQGGVFTLNTINGCGNATTTYTVVADTVKASFTASPLNGQTPLTVSYTNTSQGNSLNYSWSFGDGNNSIFINPTNVFTGAATYQTTLTAVDNIGCRDTSTIYIVVKDVPTVIIIPNVFTPNGDSINDVFSVNATGVSNFDCKVYDRWGLLLHEWTGTDGGWDGKAKNGSNCTDGTYFYLITYTDDLNKSNVKNGFFQLIR